MSSKRRKKSRRLISRNTARANSRRHWEHLAQNPLYEHDVVHSSENVIRLGLSTSSVYPMTVSECFSTAARLGYDGVEVMVTNNTETQDADLMRDLVQETGLPVLSLHAPTLLFMPRVLDRDHWQKLRITCALAEEVGARTVVLHPPFRWQGEYAQNFAAGVKSISEETGITLAVENMYPWRAGIREVLVYLPHWNPIGQGYDAVTFDFSHAAIAGMNPVDTVKELFGVLQHVHLTDGSGSLQDEHLVPGRGRMAVAETLQYLAKHDWEGDIVVEVNTRFVAKKSTRDEMLVESLEFARRHLGKTEESDAGNGLGRSRIEITASSAAPAGGDAGEAGGGAVEAELGRSRTDGSDAKGGGEA